MKQYRIGIMVLAGIVFLAGFAVFYQSLEKNSVFRYDKSEKDAGMEETGQEQDSPVQKGEKPKIALTLDDGPHPVYTAELLDGLKERNVHATFFVIGKLVEDSPDVIKRMQEEGHLIGNHTYDHVDLNKLSDQEACDQIIKTCDLLYRVTGEYVEYIRPPFGEWEDKLECEVNMIPVLWDVDPLDWNTENIDAVVNKVVTKVKENDIILLHDYFESSVKAALRIIDILQEKGFEFVTVDQLIME